jgi:hypothetical protein
MTNKSNTVTLYKLWASGDIVVNSFGRYSTLDHALKALERRKAMYKNVDIVVVKVNYEQVTR